MADKIITPEEGYNLILTLMTDNDRVAYMVVEVEEDVSDPVRHQIILRSEDIISLRDYLNNLPIQSDGK